MKTPVPSSATQFQPVVSLPAVMTVDEACAYARVSRAYFYKAIQAGKLQTVKQHKRRLVLGTDLMEYLQKSLVYGTQPKAA